MLQSLLLDEGWQFHQGDLPVTEPALKAPLYIQAKTERRRTGPAARNYDDGREDYQNNGLITHERWETVDLPHDYVIRQEPRAENNQTLGFFRQEKAWYRKHFTLDASDEGRRIVLYFEGVAVHCTVYVNGCYMLTNRCGYTSFEVDVTDVVDYDGADNVVAVEIDNSEHEGWWYEGAGIYRHVWLIKAESVSVDRYGVFVHPEKTGGEGSGGSLWRIPVDTTLRNDSYELQTVAVSCQVLDPQGILVAQCQDSVRLPAREKSSLHQCMSVKSPALWDVEKPCLYTLVTLLEREGELLERQENRFGFRTVRFDPEQGLILNGRQVKIKGVCCHQDYGLTGKAVPERVQRYRLELLRRMGANGYRTAHYPQHPYTMDVLDELGFLVMDETRWYESTPEGLSQLEMLVKRDRNHPSVILWSIGNEEPLHLKDTGRRIAQAMSHAVHKWDGTRPVTTAVSNDPIHSTVLETVDVIGVNYNLEQYDAIHEKYPQHPFVSSECCATGSTRGWYLDDCPSRGYLYGYDRDSTSWFRSRETTWKHIMARPWVAGGYQWAGIEHRGETVWPRLCSQSGAIDLYLQPKDAFYQNQSHWLDSPMVHLLPHWNHPHRLGESIRVVAYTNCPSVELYQDGVLLERKAVEPYGHAEWQVTYRPGRLVCRGYDGSGVLVCEDVVETTGQAVALRLRLESPGVRADGKDVAILTCDCVDAQGRHVPDAAPFVQLNTNGLGRVEATGSDVCDHLPVSCPDRQMRAGLLSVLVRAGRQKGMLAVYATAHGMRPARLEIPLL